MAEVKTTTAVYLTKGEQCYLRRRMRNFNEDDFMTGFKSIIIDEAYVLESEEYQDENDETKTREVERVVETIRVKAHPIKTSQVAALFSQIGKDILKTDDWLLKYDELKENALFIDTTTSKYADGLCVFNTQPTDWVKVNYV